MATPRTRRARTIILAAGLGLAVGMPAASGESAEVTVYSARSHYGQEPAMEAFTKKTGIQVKSFGGESGPLFERLKFLAGSEAAMGAWVGDIVPERAAENIREAIERG